MAELINKFSWSISQDRTFQWCKRKFYLNRYGSWGGWDKDADETTRKIYILKNQSNIPMLVGEVVHTTISKILDSLRAGSTWDITSAQEYAIGLFKTGWKQSKNKEWNDSPKKKKNLFEHYYDVLPNKKQLEETGESINNNIANFCESESFNFIKTSKPVDWLTKEDLGQFIIDDTIIYCVIDFAMKHGDRVHIYDWKTGKKTTEDERQLAIYALYAIEKWALDLNDIRLFDIYLRTNMTFKIKIPTKLLEETKDYISSRIATIKSLLDDPVENIASEENFPMIENTNICRTCSFKEICYPNAYMDL